MFRFLCLVGLFAQSSAGDGHSLGALRKSGGKAAVLVRAPEFKRRLRVCNAYAHNGSLNVYRGDDEKLTGEQPLNYKACRDFEHSLEEGDKLTFWVGDTYAGTFSVDDLPNFDAVLFLVIHRHDVGSTAVSFESHVFAHGLNSQVAVFDTFKGGAHSTPNIMDFVGGKRREALRYNSVLAVHPGEYKVELDGESGNSVAESKLVALNHECYVVLRTGIESDTDKAFPQELIVFPQSDPAALRSSSIRRGLAVAPLLIAAFAHLW